MPTCRLATPVSWITPLFCAKVVFGKALKVAASRQLTPSPSTPPRNRCRYAGPSRGCRESMQLAVRSPTVSMLLIR